jgi:hypothetical protein
MNRSDNVQKGESVFIPLNKEESEKISVSLRISNAINLVGRSQDHLLYVLKSSYSKESPNIFIFEVSGKNKIISKKSLTFSFSFGSEKYLFQADCESIENNMIKIVVVGQIFRAHRRQNFRLRIPESFKSEFFLQEHNGISLKSKDDRIWKVVDISASGLRMESKSKNLILSQGDQLKGELRFQYRPSLVIEVVVRHIRNQTFGGMNQLSVGLQIEPLTVDLENKIRSVVMDIYRDQFSMQARKMAG